MAIWEFDVRFMVLDDYSDGEYSYSHLFETVTLEGNNRLKAYWDAKREIKARYPGAEQVIIVDDRRIDAETRSNVRRPIAGHVYLLEGGGYWTIGCSTNPEVRINALKLQMPFSVNCVCLIETDDMLRLEKSLHKRFAEKCANGEWFILNADDVAYIKSLAEVE